MRVALRARPRLPPASSPVLLSRRGGNRAGPDALLRGTETWSLPVLLGRIMRALLGGAVRRQQNRALGAIGLGGWKLSLFRAVQTALRQGRAGR